jgi:hypothetical protein
VSESTRRAVAEPVRPDAESCGAGAFPTTTASHEASMDSPYLPWGVSSAPQYYYQPVPFPSASMGRFVYFPDRSGRARFTLDPTRSDGNIVPRAGGSCSAFPLPSLSLSWASRQPCNSTLAVRNAGLAELTLDLGRFVESCESILGVAPGTDIAAGFVAAHVITLRFNGVVPPDGRGRVFVHNSVLLVSFCHCCRCNGAS